MSRDYFPKQRATQPTTDMPTFIERVADYINAHIEAPYPEGKPSVASTDSSAPAPNETREQ